MSSDILNTAIKAVQSGDKVTGLRLLNELLKNDPKNETAWIWLATCLDDYGKKIYCLKRALAINPNNKVVVKALSRLELPLQPTLDDIVPLYKKEISASAAKPIHNGKEPKITSQWVKPIKNQNQAAFPAKDPSKYSKNNKKKYLAILSASLITIICGILLLSKLEIDSDLIGDNSNLVTSSTYSRSDAMQIVQNWKAPFNKGMTCKEVFDAVVYVYENNLGISDARVEWNAVKKSEFVFMVYANLKGETGWAYFSWQVTFPDQEILSLSELNICNSSSNPLGAASPKPATLTPQNTRISQVVPATRIPSPTLISDDQVTTLTLTPTDRPPLPTVSPIVITGSGNSIVSIDKWIGPALIHIRGSSGSNVFFTVTNTDEFFRASGMNQYDGVKLLDFIPGPTTTYLEITAIGEWSIDIYPLASDFMEQRILYPPGVYQGIDDDVLFIPEGKYRIIVDANSSSSNFFITARGERDDADLSDYDLLVNEIAPFTVTIDLPEWVRILEFEAEGSWTIEIIER